MDLPFYTDLARLELATSASLRTMRNRAALNQLRYRSTTGLVRLERTTSGYLQYAFGGLGGAYLKSPTLFQTELQTQLYYLVSTNI